MNDRVRLDLRNYLPYLVNRVGTALVARFTATALKDNHLSIDMWRVLAALSFEGEQRQVDLAARTSIEASTVSRLVTRLVRMGLVTRRRSQNSNREVLVALTPKGGALVQRLIPIALELEAAASEGVAARDMAVVKRALRQFYENLTKPRSAP
ncbi:MAG TPA: MarR family transcriptional regulator [Xanthobacteraceae bacterium]|nr:MarR family transcriptional regulator [Xanthobacteraceae bacterium]